MLGSKESSAGPIAVGLAAIDSAGCAETWLAAPRLALGASSAERAESRTGALTDEADWG